MECIKRLLGRSNEQKWKTQNRFLKLKSLNETRWSSRADALRAQVTSRNEIKNTLEDLIEENTQTPDTGVTAERFSKTLENFKTTLLKVIRAKSYKGLIKPVRYGKGKSLISFALLSSYRRYLFFFVLFEKRSNFDDYEATLQLANVPERNYEKIRKRKLSSGKKRNPDFERMSPRKRFRAGVFLPVINNLSFKSKLFSCVWIPIKKFKMPNMTLVMSIINFLKDEARKEGNPDTKESLEVAVQCLQTAYDIDPKSRTLAQYNIPLSLAEIFTSAFPSTEEEAEIMKNLGNNLMRSNQYSEAIRYYTAAIEIDGSNAVYFCNRAAAHSKLNDFANAIMDCERAVGIDPKYAKAYGRMGLAYTSLDQFELAIKSFKAALEIEPGNESYQSNLKIALERKASSGLSGLSSIDWHTLFSNPAFRNMASTIMQDPSIINALSARMTSSLSQAAAASNMGTSENATSSPPADSDAMGNRSLEMLLEAGQYLAQQMQAANPDLVAQFRTSSYRTPPNEENKDSPK
ncbi:small glutamine-rich tetratricopeptide repeat-containing protein beta [Trichonephila clavata]|uniref:Small glutamine-rich tetratricopeptide repeat-containing protein beta n=1 Tax=Trichonephila clavata TaxID=2740835 RepID=A0A8X6HF14_TRICU|nr:small glutamine-rich tetratricopeptide repeat-containing protein beta [Trichonephila clavata]